MKDLLSTAKDKQAALINLNPLTCVVKVDINNKKKKCIE